MEYFFAVLVLVLMVLSLMLIILSLPGTWLILILAGLWSFFASAPEFTTRFFLLLGGLAALGEIIEFGAGHYGTKYFGGSTKGSIAGMVGAIIGGILGAPVLFGLGALPGALLGGFIACWIMEIIGGKGGAPAVKAAAGATLGRLGGFIAKLGIGITMIWLCASRMWAGL